MKKEKITPIQCRDTALAFAFLGLLIWFFTAIVYFIYASMAILLWAMIWPTSWQWPARLWFGLSHILGFFMSKVLLSLIYFVILMPVALIRRIMGKDSMRLRLYKSGKKQDSVFVVREYTYSKKDLKNPY